MKGIKKKFNPPFFVSMVTAAKFVQPIPISSTKSYTIAFDLLLLWMLLPSNFKDENIFELFDWGIIQIW
jgi:hypothetical protein